MSTASLRVGVRESIVGLGRELPYACGPTDLPPLIREVDQPLSLKDGEVLADSHGRNVQPFPHPRCGLGPVRLKLEEDTVPTGTGWGFRFRLNIDPSRFVSRSLRPRAAFALPGVNTTPPIDFPNT